ncbi:MAG: hypothetical protein LRY69_05590 [Gammaproteobacteria bacterium]|nr:hypothetical protein [Gammaproteobacteria bacterium]
MSSMIMIVAWVVESLLMRRNMAYSLIIGFMALIGYVYAHNIHLIISQHLNTDMILAYVSGWMLNLNTPPYTLSDAYLAAHSASTKTFTLSNGVSG